MRKPSFAEAVVLSSLLFTLTTAYAEGPVSLIAQANAAYARAAYRVLGVVDYKVPGLMGGSKTP
jgi:hypothetical protein